MIRSSFAVAVVLSTLAFGCEKPKTRTNLRPGVAFDVHKVATQEPAHTNAFIDPETGETIDLVVPPVITAANVIAASVGRAPRRGAALLIFVDDAGAARMQAATGKQRKIAIVVNGKIVQIATTETPASSVFMVTGSLTRPEMEALVQ